MFPVSTACLQAWDALDLPDPEAARTLAADESVPEIVRRAQILARIDDRWLLRGCDSDNGQRETLCY